jgi:hypothetical protein
LFGVGSEEVGKNILGSVLVLTPQDKLARTFLLPMFVDALPWLPDSSGLFFIGAEKSTGYTEVELVSLIPPESYLESATTQISTQR